MSATAAPAPSELLRRIGALAGPTMVQSLLQAFAQLFETWLAARQGTAALAGWAVVLPFALLLQQMSAGAMGGGVVSAIARALGGRRDAEASALVVHAVLIAAMAALVFAVALAGFPRGVFGAIAGASAAEAAAPYAIWLFGAGALPAWLSNTLASVLRGGGRHGLAARVIACVWIAIPAASWFFAEVLGFGLAGIGMGFALVFWVASFVMAAVVLRGGAGFTPDLRARIAWVLFKRILAVGLVACLLASIANLTTILVTMQIAHHGAAAVAAYGISARLEFLMIPLAFGIGSALTALVGRAVGAGDWVTARRTAWTGALIALSVAGSVGAFVGLQPALIAGAFTTDAAVAAIATRAIAIIGPALGGFGLGMALYFASMGAGRMRWPVLAALSRIGLATGLGWVLAVPLGWGLEGHFVGVALGITAYGLVTAAAVRPGVWPGR
ncbi:MAG TPA: MATE family efflux transporter [Roseomonas sp.]|jgi:Na+-driven multidrug efflux pump